MREYLSVIPELFIIMIIITVWYFKDSLKNDKTFIVKKICDIILHVVYYLFVIKILQIKNLSTSQWTNFIPFFFIVGGIFMLYLAFTQIKEINKETNINKNLSFILIISSWIIGIIVSFSIIYYSLFSINNFWFDISEIQNTIHLPFEFIYFSFSVTITYSGSGIIATGIIPKIVQMLHILIFYLYFADVIITLFKRND